MINSSYYDDISLVKETLDRIETVKETNETLLESFNHVSKLHEEFSNAAKDYSPIDDIFTKSYEKLTQAYIALEALASHVDNKCKVIYTERGKIIRLSYMLLDDRSNLIRAQMFVGGQVPVEYLKGINRLWKESSVISFRMNREDKEVLFELEQYVNRLQ